MEHNIPTPQDIAARAHALGLTTPALCKAAGIAPSTFNRWINGKTDPLKPYRRLIAKLEELERGE